MTTHSESDYNIMTLDGLIDRLCELQEQGYGGLLVVIGHESDQPNRASCEEDDEGQFVRIA